jgi:hypothetical protein
MSLVKTAMPILTQDLKARVSRAFPTELSRADNMHHKGSTIYLKKEESDMIGRSLRMCAIDLKLEALIMEANQGNTQQAGQLKMRSFLTELYADCFAEKVKGGVHEL